MSWRGPEPAGIVPVPSACPNGSDHGRFRGFQPVRYLGISTLDRPRVMACGDGAFGMAQPCAGVHDRAALIDYPGGARGARGAECVRRHPFKAGNSDCRFPLAAEEVLMMQGAAHAVSEQESGRIRGHDRV